MIKPTVIIVFVFCLGLILGFMICMRRGNTYFLIRKQADSVKEQLSLLPETPLRKPVIYLLGDSLVKRGDWRFLDTQYASVNLGMGGARINDVIGLITENKVIKSGRAILLVGINDLADRRALEDMLTDYERLIDLCISQDLKVTVLSLPAVSGGGDYDRRPSIVSFNDQLGHIANKAAVKFVELNDALCDEEGLKSGYTSDNLHLTLKAYQQLAPLLNTL